MVPDAHCIAGSSVEQDMAGLNLSAYRPAAPRIVVFRTGHLGDTVCAIPAFRLLRKHLGNAHMTLLCDYPAGGKVPAWDVIERLELFDSVVAYESGKGWKTWYQLFTLMRKLHPDLLVQLPQVDRSAKGLKQQRMFFRLAGVRRLIGFSTLASPSEWHPNEPSRLIQLLNQEGIVGAKPDYGIPVSQPALLAVKCKFQALGVNLEKPYAVFCGGGKTATQALAPGKIPGSDEGTEPSIGAANHRRRWARRS